MQNNKVKINILSFLVADEKDDKTSLDRSLDHSLFLVLKNNNSWTLPIAHNEKGKAVEGLGTI